MQREQFQRHFFLGLFIGMSVFILFVFLPFLKVIAMAAILAALLYPLYSYILKHIGHKKRRTASLLVLVIVAVIIIIPATLIGVKIVNESVILYQQVSNSNVDNLQYLTTAIETPVQRFFPEFTFNVQSYIGIAAAWIANNIVGFLSGTIHSFVNGVLLIVSLFFFLKDGPEFKRALIRLSPLSNTFDEQIFGKVEKTINSVIKGMLLIALIQGVLAGIGLTIFGIPNATLWGGVAAICALIPGLGTSLVVFPAILYLFVTGNMFSAIGLLIWGICVVGLVDNFLAPYIYSRGIKIHPLLILFSVLGGLLLFGPAGFILGPIVLTLFLSLVDIYQEYILHEKADVEV